MKPRRVDFSTPRGQADLIESLRRLTFGDNFNLAFKWSGNIPAGEEVFIRNQTGLMNLSWTILRLSGSAPLIEGSIWSDINLTIKNLGTTDAKATIVFFKETE